MVISSLHWCVGVGFTQFTYYLKVKMKYLVMTSKEPPLL